MSHFIDSHCHLDHPSFKHDLTAVLQEAIDIGIDQFIVPGTAFHQWEKQQQLEQKYPNIYFAYGIHPWFCDLHHEEHLEQLDILLNHAIAVGECGLDFSPNKPKKDKQTYWFEAQLRLAEKHHLPLIIHSVKAYDEITTCLKKHVGLQGVIHGFAGSTQQAKILTALGFYIAIGSRLVHQNPAKVDILVNAIPLSSILLETDAPDGLGKEIRNEPKKLIVVANIIAKLRNLPTEEVLSICSKNAKDLFRL
jgi:TatD DNase family protein